MFNKKLLSLKNLNYLYLFINLLSFTLILGFIVFMVNESYHFYLKENFTFQQSKISNSSNIHLDVFLQNLLLQFLITTIKIAILTFITLTIKFLIFKIPLTSNFLIQLDKNQEISSILGRFISYHFRKNSSINFSNLIFLYQEAEYEKYIIESHSRKNKFNYFLKKYDKNYTEDLDSKNL